MQLEDQHTAWPHQGKWKFGTASGRHRKAPDRSPKGIFPRKKIRQKSHTPDLEKKFGFEWETKDWRWILGIWRTCRVFLAMNDACSWAITATSSNGLRLGCSKLCGWSFGWICYRRHIVGEFCIGRSSLILPIRNRWVGECGISKIWAKVKSVTGQWTSRTVRRLGGARNDGRCRGNYRVSSPKITIRAPENAPCSPRFGTRVQDWSLKIWVFDPWLIRQLGTETTNN